jgi:hypothetical protein
VAIALGGAMVAAACLVLWLGRDTTFTQDELVWFSTSPHLDLRAAIEPYNGHLILVTRLVYAAMLNAFGPGYLAFRLLAMATVLLTAGLFFVYARRRVGAVIALAPTLVLLVYGSDADHVLSGNGFTVLLGVASGLGALLALERDDLRGDVTAFLLLCVAVATYSVGLAFVAAAAVFTLVPADRWRRAWVWLLPALLYGVWFLWSRHHTTSTESYVELSNLLLVPNWALNSLASVGAAVVGLGYDYPPSASAWGPFVALAALAGLGVRLWRRNIPRALWAAMAVPAVLWTMGAITSFPPFRVPDSPRFMFPGTIAVLLVAAEASRGLRLGRRGVVLLYLVAAVSLLTNIALLREASGLLRVTGSIIRTDLTTVEIAGGRFGSRLGTASPEISASASTEQADVLGLGNIDSWVGTVLMTTGQPNVATGYMDAVGQYESPAFSLTELREQPEQFREHADTLLADNLGVRLQPDPSPPQGCHPVGGGTLQLPPGGAVLKSTGSEAPVALRRFGTGFAVQAGTLTPGNPMILSVPRDAVPEPWYASIPAAGVSICRLPV